MKLCFFRIKKVVNSAKESYFKFWLETNSKNLSHTNSSSEPFKQISTTTSNINQHVGQGSQNEVKNKVRNFVRNFRPIFVQQSHPKVDQIDRNSETVDRHTTSSSRIVPSSRYHDYYDYSQWIPVTRKTIT